MTIRSLFLAIIFISSSFSGAFAQEAAATEAQSGLTSFIPLILIFLVFYFLLIRPQQKKIREHQNILDNLKAGNKVHTNGGLIGVIKSVDKKDNQVDLEIASGVVVKILKTSVLGLVKEDKKSEKKPEKKLENKKSKKKN
jgi:preprotein translocase subunit YajC